MTAINITIAKRAAFMISDCAYLDVDFRMVSLASKVLALPEFSAAVAIRGASILLPSFHQALVRKNFGTGCSFDELRSVFPSVAKSTMDHYRTLPNPEKVFDEAEFFLIGWTATDGPQGVTVASHGEDPALAWLPKSLTEYNIAPCTTTSAKAFHKLLPPAVDDFVPEVHGALMIDRQRATAFPTTHRGRRQKVRSVGGIAQLTKIDSDGIHQKIIRRWPDKIGERIAP